MTTFCNTSLRRIASVMGYEFPQELANAMIARMASDPRWSEDTIERGHAHAMDGGLAVICLSDEPHGHVTVIYPASMEISGTWGGPVPMVAHVGNPPNGIRKMSAAFRLSDKPKMKCYLLDIGA